MEELGTLFFLTGLALAVTVLHSFLKQAGRDEYAYLTLVLGLTIALIKVIPVILTLFSEVQAVFGAY